jgi:hypothetical protein
MGIELRRVGCRLLALFIACGFCFGQPVHPERRGLLASPGLDGQPVKAVYFFPGEVGPNSNLFTAHPVNPDDQHWNSVPASRARVVDRMAAAHVNTVVMSYWSNMPQWSPMLLNGASLTGVLDAAGGRRLVIIPAIEGGFDTSHPEIPHWQFQSDFPHPAGSTAFAPGLVQRIGALVQLFEGRRNLWAQMYDRTGTARYAVSLIHTCSDQGVSDSEFAAAFDKVADQVQSAFHIPVGFTLDLIGGCHYVAIPEKAGTLLTGTVSVLAAMGFESEVFSGKVISGPPCADPDWRKCIAVDNNRSNLPALADWKRAAVHDWVATGLPMILDVSNGFDGRVVWKSKGAGFWGDNMNYSDDRWRNWLSELKGAGIRGIVMDTWNGYTEGYAAVPTAEHGEIVYNWLSDLLEPDPGDCSHMHYVNGTRTFRVYGGICEKWVQLGADRGFAVPVGNESPSAHGRVQQFADGRAIYWGPTTGAHEVQALIGKAYQSAGADHSCLGLPISDEQADGAGRISRFEHGTITWKPGDALGHVNCH